MDMTTIIMESALKNEAGGYFASAEVIYRGLLRDFPDHVGGAHRLGRILFSSGRYDEGLTWLEKAAMAEKKEPYIWYDLGCAYDRLQRYGDAVIAYEAVTEQAPLHAEAWFKLGLARSNLKQDRNACDAFHRAIEISRSEIDKDTTSFKHYSILADSMSSLGRLLKNVDMIDDSINYYNISISINPTSAETLCSLGTTLMELDRPDQAVRAYGDAIALEPDFAEAFRNKGIALLEIGQIEKAEEALASAVSLAPDQPVNRFNLSILQLLKGDYQAGWVGHEDRLRLKPSPIPIRNFNRPRWSGGDLTGQTILLHAEQGLGDSIQFLRYVPMVAAHGANIILELQRPLLRFDNFLTSICHVVAQGDDLPQFDCYCPLPSLPLYFDTTLENIPSPDGYLQSRPELRLTWAKRLPSSPRLKVGLVWAGSSTHSNDRHRSISFEQFSPFWECENVQWYSLQLGPHNKDIAGLSAGQMEDLSPWLTDLAETAAALECLDLVISVDTAVAHLAGALGRPCWLLLPFAPDWRWLTEREDSPWYSSLRLFRQRSPGKWSDLLEYVAAELKDASGFSPK